MASGTIAICKYNKLMFTSPKAMLRGYEWLDTLSHEYVHFVISVISNLLPGRFAEIVARAAAGDFAGARAIHFELLPLMGALFVETNPIPVKAAMAMAGLAGGMSDEVRLPLTPLTQASRPRLEAALAAAGLLG